LRTSKDCANRFEESVLTAKGLRKKVLMRVKVILQEFGERVLMALEESVLIGVKVIRVEYPENFPSSCIIISDS
jgi:hypothetical protein